MVDGRSHSPTNSSQSSHDSPSQKSSSDSHNKSPRDESKDNNPKFSTKEQSPFDLVNKQMPQIVGHPSLGHGHGHHQPKSEKRAGGNALKINLVPAPEDTSSKFAVSVNQNPNEVFIQSKKARMRRHTLLGQGNISMIFPNSPDLGGKNMLNDSSEKTSIKTNSISKELFAAKLCRELFDYMQR